MKDYEAQHASSSSAINFEFVIADDGTVIIEDSFLSLDSLSSTENVELTINIERDLMTEPLDCSINKEQVLDSQVALEQPVATANINVNNTLKNIENVLSVQTKDKLDKTSSSLPDNVPAIFKECTFWPEEMVASKKRPQREKVPSILSSKDALKWATEKRNNKRKLEEDKSMKKQIRIEKQKIKQEKDEEKRQKKLERDKDKENPTKTNKTKKIPTKKVPTKKVEVRKIVTKVDVTKKS